MKLLVSIMPLAVASLCVGCAAAPKHAEVTKPPKPTGDLVFLGTVISATPNSDFWYMCIITTRVDKVLSGSFSGKTFQFPVHSAPTSNLEIGKQYTIRAIRSQDGNYFTVDENQWLHATPTKPR